MAISLPRKRSKRSNKTDHSKESISSRDSSFAGRFLGRIPVALLLLFIIFLWSSSTTFISGSIVHVCVTSRKLNNLYCLSAGTQPANFEIPLHLVNSTKKNNNNNNTIISHWVESATRQEILNVLQKSQEPIDNATHEASAYSTGSLSYGADHMRNIRDKTREDEVAGARKEVHQNMQILRSYISKGNNSKCDGRGIYVYDLPAKFNKDLLSQCHDMITWMNFCKFLSNQALGEPVWELGPGWYNTHQYSLEPIFHSRVLRHPCRVWSVYDAKLFYVPFYGGLDILRWHFKNIANDVKDKLSLELIEWLQLQDSWNKKFGFDHVFVLGKISWDFRRLDNSSWGTRLLQLDEMQNPMKLLIERQPWHGNDVGIPHPTFFHPRSDADIEAWQKKIMGTERKTLVSFAGAARPQAIDTIRSVLIEQCSSSDKCKHVDCKDGSCSRPKPIIDLFTGSEFCLQPPGDSPTRKSLFDSLISGCITVLFDPFTAYHQYPWHLPEDYNKYSVYIDKEEVKTREVNVVERLMRIPDEERKQMRRYIVHELMPRLVYAHPNSKLERFQDASTIAINNLLERVSRLP